MATIMAYKATADILSAYDDEKVGTATGIIEISRCGACGGTTATAVFGGYAAQASDTTSRMDEIYMLACEAAHKAIIETGASSGCQLGTVCLGEEIPGAYKGIALDILNEGNEA